MDWNPSQYLKFAAERSLAVRDLAQHVAAKTDAARMRRIADLGCGPGSSTAVLAEFWPEAKVTGFDVSEEMLVAARAAHPRLNFAVDDIRSWADGEAASYELVFSNSALQWVPDHLALLPRLFARVAPGGALAFQVPANMSAPTYLIPWRLAASATWKAHFPAETIREWRSAELTAYYDGLAPLAASQELWETEYVQVMPDVAAILEWYKGSGLRPFLAALPDDSTRERFCSEYLEGLRVAYLPQADGRVLFPFRRRFVIAWAR